MVAAAAAWVWTARPDLTAGQVAEILRRSATDIARRAGPGVRVRHVERGRGARAPRPIRDPFEPNDDIDEVDPNGDRFVSKEPALTTVSRRSARSPAGSTATRIPGRLPRLAPGRRAQSPRRSPPRPTATSPCTRPPRKPSSAGTRPTAALRSRRPRERASGSRTSNKGKGRWAYVSVKPAASVLDATYTLAFTRNR